MIMIADFSISEISDGSTEVRRFDIVWCCDCDSVSLSVTDGFSFEAQHRLWGERESLSLTEYDVLTY